MKTYLKLEGKLGTKPCTNTYPLDKNSSPWKTPVPNKAEKKKRANAPIKRRFKVRLIEQALPINPTLPVNPTSTVVTTMVPSTQTAAVKPTATTANPTPIPVTVYNQAQSRIQEIPNPPIRKFQGEEGPLSPNRDNPLQAQQPKTTTTATTLQTSDTLLFPSSTPIFLRLIISQVTSVAYLSLGLGCHSIQTN